MHPISRILGTREYRGLSQVDKAIKLHDEQHVSYREAAALTGVSASAIFRAKKARAEDRQVGVRGRPKVLGNKGEDALVRYIKEADNNKRPMSFRKLRDKV